MGYALISWRYISVLKHWNLRWRGICHQNIRCSVFLELVRSKGIDDCDELSTGAHHS